jgi:hypothetical protein
MPALEWPSAHPLGEGPSFDSLRGPIGPPIATSALAIISPMVRQTGAIATGQAPAAIGSWGWTRFLAVHPERAPDKPPPVVWGPLVGVIVGWADGQPQHPIGLRLPIGTDGPDVEGHRARAGLPAQVAPGSMRSVEAENVALRECRAAVSANPRPGAVRAQKNTTRPTCDRARVWLHRNCLPGYPPGLVLWASSDPDPGRSVGSPP